MREAVVNLRGGRYVGVRLRGFSRDRRRVGAALLLALLMTLSGCGKDYDVATRVSSPGESVPLGICRFEQSGRLPVPPSPSNWATEQVDPGQGYRPAGRYPTADRRTISVRRRTLLAGRSYTFVITRNKMGLRDWELLWLRPGKTEQVILDSRQLGSGFSGFSFDVAPFADSLVIVVSTKQGIVHVIARRSGRDGLVFSTPTIEHASTGGTAEPILCTSAERLHLLWMQSGLVHASTDDPSVGWSAPRLISTTVNSDSASIVADGREVFIGWSDSRFERNVIVDIRNDGKILVMRSEDEGDTFGRPVLLSDVADESDCPHRLYMVPAGDELVLFWRSRGSSIEVTWKAGIVDRELSTLRLVNGVPSADLRSSYEERMRALLAVRPRR